MGPSNAGCDRLQRIERKLPFCFFFVLVLAFLTVVESARAQIIPFQGTLAYSSSSSEVPALTVKAADGSPAYVLTFYLERDAKKNLVGLNLVLHRPGARYGARNLLEPPHRWHGLQEYMFIAPEFERGLNGGPYGVSREIQIKTRKLDVKFSATEAEVVPVDNPPVKTLNYAFKELVIDVAVDNLK
jgi:hypothetical protein